MKPRGKIVDIKFFIELSIICVRASTHNLLWWRMLKHGWTKLNQTAVRIEHTQS